MTTLTPTEAAKHLKISDVTLWEYCNREENPLPYYGLSPKTRRFYKEEVDEWVRSQRGNPEEGREIPSQAKDQREAGLPLRSNRDRSGKVGGSGGGNIQAVKEAYSK